MHTRRTESNQSVKQIYQNCIYLRYLCLRLEEVEEEYP